LLHLISVNSGDEPPFVMLAFLMNRPVPVCLFLACLGLAACLREPNVQRAEFFVFGTVLDVSVQGVDRATANRAFAELQRDFQAMHRDWHAWEPGMLTRVNEAFAAGRSATANADIVELIRRSQQLETLSGGRLNPAIGALIGLWGFHTSDYPILGPPPPAEAIERLVERNPSSSDIRIDGLTLSSTNPAVQLDFGGIAKGYAVDRACERLIALGVGNAIVNAGGDLRAMGNHGDRPWRVAIRDPRGGIIGSLETGADEAVFTSGNYERFRQHGAERYPHILDPRTGWPVQALSSVTVVASEGVLADAAATALTVAGPDEWIEVARALGLEQVLLVDAEGRAFLTPAMQRRVALVEGVESEVVDISP
jgi:thiamine biosynthesis lipoprotein